MWEYLRNMRDAPLAEKPSWALHLLVYLTALQVIILSTTFGPIFIQFLDLLILNGFSQAELVTIGCLVSFFALIGVYIQETLHIHLTFRKVIIDKAAAT